jgi:hypothetical protein
MKKAFLLLLAANEQNRVAVAGVVERIRRHVDPAAHALWQDSKGAGIFISSALTSNQIWDHAMPRDLPHSQQQSLRDMLVVQVGPDFAGYAEARSVAWLNARFPSA